MEWTRTGKITMRSGDFLIIKYPTHYLALHGPQTDRKTIGRYPSANEAKEACLVATAKGAKSGFDSNGSGSGGHSAESCEGLTNLANRRPLAGRPVERVVMRQRE